MFCNVGMAGILVVEDQSIIAEDLKDIIVRLGYRADSVDNGLDAIARVKLNLPDLVFMDVRLNGEMDGMEAATILMDRFRVPIVFVSALPVSEVLRKVPSAFGSIRKPFQDADVQGWIEKALVHRKEQTAGDCGQKSQEMSA